MLETSINMTKKHLFLTLLLHLAVTVSAQKMPQVKVEQGTLEGIILPSGINNYRGIPYAQPPIGDLRWKAPQSPKKWSGVRKADAFGNKAMQKPIYSDMNFRASSISEDCLYLNIWTPAKKPNEKLPVLVYFYGGGFIAGDGSEYRYDGESLAQKGIVTVTLNYRLGIFGFFSHPELTKESPNHASGNYGLLDQNAALLWVKKNIAAFGGDPDKITIAGESAGSISVSAQMASPLSKKLIAGAIGQSGAMIGKRFGAIPLKDAEKSGVAFAEEIQANELAKLRQIPAEVLMEESSEPGNFDLKIVADGYFLNKQITEVFANGEQAKVPLLAGWTSAEIPYMAFMHGQYPSPENYKKLVQDMYKENANEVLKYYPGNTQEEVIESATALGSDNFIVFGTWKWLNMHRKTAKQPTYSYIFSKARPSEEAKANEGGMPAPLKGANHASDIEYMLGNLPTNTVYKWTADDYKTSEIAEEYIANFIKTGNPNGKGLPEWPVNKEEGDLNIMTLDKVSKPGKEKHRDRYLFLDSYETVKK